MAAIDLARQYISLVNGRDGAAVAELFTGDGEIIDPTGHHHRGRAAIAAFVEAAPERTLAHVADRTMGTHRVVLHGTIMTENTTPAAVEWEFEVDGDRIRRLTIQTTRPDPRVH